MIKLKPSLTLQAVIASINAGQPIFLHGSPGVGKTSMFDQAAAATKRRLLVTRLALMEPVDLYGIGHIIDGEVVQAKPKWFPKDGDEPLIWFFDEWLQGTTACQNAAGQILNERRLGDWRLPDNVYIAAASNRLSDRAGTTRMPSQVARRFVHVEMETDLRDVTRFGLAHDWATEVIAFLNFRPELLCKFDPNSLTNPNPASWEKVSVVQKSNPGPEIAHALYAGLVGEGEAAEYSGFVEMAKKMPNADAILMNPKKAEVPDKKEAAVIFALCGTLARKATAQNMDRVIIYAERLPEEFQVLLVKQAVDRDPLLANTRPFIQWAVDHQDAMN